MCVDPDSDRVTGRAGQFFRQKPQISQQMENAIIRSHDPRQTQALYGPLAQG